MQDSKPEITILFPDDWHCHLRDDPYLALTVKMAARQFRRVIVMPNLQRPVIDVSLAQNYLQRIQRFSKDFPKFSPLMTLYLTNETTAPIINEAKKSGIIFGCKLYPAGVTTHSNHGVTDFEKLYPALEAMEKNQLPLLIHGEVNDPLIDIFDRERVFIDRYLTRIVKQFPSLKIVLEHITTQEAVKYISEGEPELAATITPHHLLLNRNDLFTGGIKPHYYCAPILKRQAHQEALIQAATSGNPKFFIGTDSAPHAKTKKESPCGCAGIYSHFAAMELYAHVFEQANSLDKLEGFTSRFGAAFYGLPLNTDSFVLRKESLQIPQTLPFGNEELVPFLAGEHLAWKQAADKEKEDI